MSYVYLLFHFCWKIDKIVIVIKVTLAWSSVLNRLWQTVTLTFRNSRSAPDWLIYISLPSVNSGAMSEVISSRTFFDTTCFMFYAFISFIVWLYIWCNNKMNEINNCVFLRRESTFLWQRAQWSIIELHIVRDSQFIIAMFIKPQSSLQPCHSVVQSDSVDPTLTSLFVC